MSKPKNKVVRRLLIALAIIVLMGGCFGAVAMYAKNEMSKPKFQMPEIAPQASATALPGDDEGLFDYVSGLYAAAVASDEAEGSRYTDVGLDLDLSGAALPEADSELLQLIKDRAVGQIGDCYPRENNVRMDGDHTFPAWTLTSADVTEISGEQGVTEEDGTVRDDDFYFIRFSADPATADAEAAKAGDVFGRITETLAPALTAENLTLSAQSVDYECRVDRITDHLLNMDVKTVWLVEADAVFTGDCAALGTQHVTLTYTETAHESFMWYGAKFLERAIAANVGDMTALPAEVRVNADAQSGEDFTMTYTASDPDAITIDGDGVMTVHKAPEETVIITMTLEYGAHTYTDELTVYITELELEVENNG